MRLLALASALLATLALSGSSAVRADNDATITLSTSPAPPEVVENPGGEVTISWQVTSSTTPDRVVYTLFNPSWVTVEQETYQGATGMGLSREWQVPFGAPGGAYWVRVEFFSVEAGNEATAEVRFLVEDSPTANEPSTWGRIKSLF